MRLRDSSPTCQPYKSTIVSLHSPLDVPTSPFCVNKSEETEGTEAFVLFGLLGRFALVDDASGTFFGGAVGCRLAVVYESLLNVLSLVIHGFHQTHVPLPSLLALFHLLQPLMSL